MFDDIFRAMFGHPSQSPFTPQEEYYRYAQMSGLGQQVCGVSPFNLGYPSQQEKKKENVMEFTAHYTVNIRKIGNHFLVKCGNHEFIADDIKAAGKAITKLLTEAYKEKS